VFAICWAAPVVEQVRHGRDGNLARMWAFFIHDRQPRGIVTGLQIISHELGVFGSWWHGIGGFDPFSGDIDIAHSAAVPALVLPLAASVVLSRRRGDVVARNAVALSVTLIVSAIVALGGIDGGVYPYLVRWVGVVGWWTITACLISVGRAFAASGSLLRKLNAAGVAAAIAITVPATIAGVRSGLAYDTADRSLAEVARQVEPKISRSHSVLVLASGGLESEAAAKALLLDLEKQNLDAFAPEADAAVVGVDRTRPTTDAVRIVVIVVTITAQIPDIEDATEIARVDELTNDQRVACEEWGERAAVAFSEHDVEAANALGDAPVCGDLFLVLQLV